MNAAGNMAVYTTNEYVRTAQYNGIDWGSYHNDIILPTPGTTGGVSMNAAGNRFAVSTKNNSNVGLTSIYQWDGDVTWTKMGLDINGGANSFEAAISMNAAGDRVACGWSNLDLVRVFNWNGTSWVKLGQDITVPGGIFSNESVSLNDAGNIVAIGNTSGAGTTRVYSLIGTTWTKMGQDIIGEAVDDMSGYSISLNAAGDRIAIGAPGNDGAGTDYGHVRVYSWDSVNWNRVGLDISGNLHMGRSVRLNSTGSVLFTLGQSEFSTLGHVLIYDQQ